MHVGMMGMATDYYTDWPERIRAIEDLGFESLFFGDHSHIPVSRRSPYRYGPERQEVPLPDFYRRSLDPFVILSLAAGITSRLKLGLGVCLVVERDPITLAKEVASLDYLSGGRVLFGVGAGWNLEEMEEHGTARRLRWTLLRERVLAMKRIWTEDEAEFQGELVRFDPLWSWPKPTQKPHPPVLVGSSGPGALRRVVEYGDGWAPIEADQSLDQLCLRMDELRQRSRDAGREALPVTIFAATPQPAVLEQYAELGVERVLFASFYDPDDREWLTPLKRLAQLARPFQ